MGTWGNYSLSDVYIHRDKLQEVLHRIATRVTTGAEIQAHILSIDEDGDYPQGLLAVVTYRVNSFTDEQRRNALMAVLREEFAITTEVTPEGHIYLVEWDGQKLLLEDEFFAILGGCVVTEEMKIKPDAPVGYTPHPVVVGSSEYGDQWRFRYEGDKVISEAAVTVFVSSPEEQKLVENSLELIKMLQESLRLATDMLEEKQKSAFERGRVQGMYEYTNEEVLFDNGE